MMINWHFHSWHDFFVMGGQAIFVWSSYVLVLGTFVLVSLNSYHRLRQALLSQRDASNTTT